MWLTTCPDTFDDWLRAGHVTEFWPMNNQRKSPVRPLGKKFAF